jgi:uncharacterized Zn-binding protein involved in type VI secretion
MPSVAVNPPKTPVTKGSNGFAAATLPNVCKMPGPPAPFVPTPLPNVGQSGKQPSGYSTSVEVEGQPVAIAGASFGSTGDIASKGTGGGMVSNNAEGPTKFLAPGSLNVKIEGKNVQHLGDQMLNNCGPGGSPANAATLEGEAQGPALAQAREDAFKCAVKECDRKPLTRAQKAEVAAAAPKQCAKLGEIKHACVEEKMSKDPDCRSERTYDMRKRPPRVVRDNTGKETVGYLEAKKALIAAGENLRKLKGLMKRPDAIFGKRAPYQVLDAKFPCSKKVRSGKLGSGNVLLSARRSGETMMTDEQRFAYQAIANGRSKTPGTVKAISPHDARDTKC